MDRYPAVRIWAVGGHSLGGATAATVAHAHPEVGLLLWAAATVWTIADTSLPASWSISGTRDTLAGPTDIQESRPELPANTCFVAVEGAIDGYFGDFGAQEGDGVPTVGRAAAQAQIVAATRQFLRALRFGDTSCPR